jgi:uncharacterized protein (DUF2126 family)/transglutaminase-like putative cysteine protease
MSIHVALRHVTRYRFDRPTRLSPHVIRLRPAPHCRTPIVSYSLKITPEEHFINWQQDPQSNYLARLVFDKPTRELAVEVDLVAEMAVFNPFDFFLEPNAEHFPFRYDPVLAHELEPYHRKLPITPQLGDYIRGLRQQLLGKNAHLLPSTPAVHSEVAHPQNQGGILPETHVLNPTPDNDPRPRTIDFLVALNQKVSADIGYTIRLEPGVQTPEETLETGTGSCRDTSWLLTQILRHFGLAARFVSGYLIQLKPDVASLDGPSGAEQDFTDLHAWCEVYLPGAGWVGLDPTSGLMAGEGHLPLAATPDPQSAAPITGATDVCEVSFDFAMNITRVKETPRVTKPYTEDQWLAIDSLGKKVDQVLSSQDVRLTMGGEPTFVSIDDMDGEEWNTTAIGPNKRRLSNNLLQRLQKHFAPGGLLFHGQGKWYPGEQLPRFALACYWRKDGTPIWQNHGLIANEEIDYGHTATHARRFALALGDILGVDTRHLQAGYEDAFYYLWKERRLPSNVDPHDSNLKDPLERERLAKVFSQGLDHIVGYALPLKRDWVRGRLTWRSGSWFLRDERMYLIPGDSPMGYRLPLDSLPWVSEKDFPWVYPPDPLAPRPPLPTTFPNRQKRIFPLAEWIRQHDSEPPRNPDEGPQARSAQSLRSPRADHPSEDGDHPPGPGESASWIIRSALCTEARHGRVHVFLPPVSHIEDFLDLIAAIEDTAAALQMPIIIEGTPPPYDPRLQVIKVTPDPGVIEVNMHPTSTWDELTHATTVLYDQARLSRLGTEKFMMDGRHTGTGGGNHIVVGGETPADSPLLRRPHLLRSLISYWHNHPSLSYLFSGLFIGPTSQAPRVDEARNDALYELELAFKQIPDNSSITPWLVDRILRHLLTDVTGNTHRTEFCIDKLYSPDSPTGRLGLLELRSFEMPPHAHMSLAQHLLLRTAIARFWDEPYHQPLIRWETTLHDRFLLPHFVWQDIQDVMQDMTESGFPMDPEWFAPHYEFRFPTIGECNQRGIQMEWRTALEPWNVLGEEGNAGSTVRFVDSSLERIQLKLSGFTPGRYLITCNGHTVPLHSTGTQGEFVAGIRYRAWQPPSCLHPTIGVDSPLIFDLYDTWNQRSLGGATYHVVHPGGLSYETLPVNSYEAESRRLNRFFTHGHSQGNHKPTPPSSSAEFPVTLDLRTKK